VEQPCKNAHGCYSYYMSILYYMSITVTTSGAGAALCYCLLNPKNIYTHLWQLGCKTKNKTNNIKQTERPRQHRNQTEI